MSDNNSIPKPISAFTAAKTLGEFSSWSLSNLQIQKILYFAHMCYFGKNKERLVRATFHAWDYGPVIPSLYRKLKVFGAEDVRDIFWNEEIADEPKHIKILEEAADVFTDAQPGMLIALTHRDGGAWGKHYMSGITDIVIPNEDIIAEYEKFYAPESSHA